MSAMANATPVITTIMNTDGREKTPRETDTAPQASIQEFCEKHYDDILPIIMEKARQDKRKGLQSRLDFGDTPKRARRIRSDSFSLGDRNSPARYYHRRGKSKTDAKRKDEDRSVVNHLIEIVLRTGAAPESEQATSVDVGRVYGEDLLLQWTGHKDRSRIDGSRGIILKILFEVEEGSLAVLGLAEDVDPFIPRIRAASVWFDELPAKSIDGYKDLKAAFLSYFMQQKKYVKDPVEIHNIKQKDGETIEEFMERFKTETGRMKGAPECMRISGFMHGVNNPLYLTNTTPYERYCPRKIMEEMMTTTAAFIRGETAAASKKKVHAPWKSQDQSKRHASDRKLEFQKPDFRNQPREGRGSNKFTPLTRTPKEIFTAEAAKFKPPAPMVTPLEKRSDSSKFWEKDPTAGQEMVFPAKIKRKANTCIQSGRGEIRRRPSRYKSRDWGDSRSTAHVCGGGLLNGSTLLKMALIGSAGSLEPDGHRNYVTNRFFLEGRRKQSGGLGKIRLLVTIGDAEHSTEAWMNFMIVRSPSPYNGIIGRPGIKAIQAIPSTTQGHDLPFPV
ncbi:reverse transcriptase domain-containing protein [Tanacetum coccineum]